MTTLLYTHPDCLDHDPGHYHTESPARLRAVLEALDTPEFAGLERREAPEAEIDDIARVHPRRFVERILAAVPSAGHVGIDADTVLSPRSGRCGLVRRTASPGSRSSISTSITATARRPASPTMRASSMPRPTSSRSIPAPAGRVRPGSATSSTYPWRRSPGRNSSGLV